MGGASWPREKSKGKQPPHPRTKTNRKKAKNTFDRSNQQEGASVVSLLYICSSSFPSLPLSLSTYSANTGAGRLVCLLACLRLSLSPISTNLSSLLPPRRQTKTPREKGVCLSSNDKNGWMDGLPSPRSPHSIPSPSPSSPPLPWRMHQPHPLTYSLTKSNQSMNHHISQSISSSFPLPPKNMQPAHSPHSTLTFLPSHRRPSPPPLIQDSRKKCALRALNIRGDQKNEQDNDSSYFFLCC